MGYVLESACLEVVVLLATLAVFLYRYATATYGYWKDRGVPFVPPLPFFGNSLRTAFGLDPLSQAQKKNYEFFGEHRFGGTYAFRRPTFFIKDPDLVEQVLKKDFSTFYNRGFRPDTELDPLSNHLVNLEDSKWKNLRNKLTPAFSSNKLKSMQGQLNQCADLLLEHLEPFAKTQQPFEAKRVMSGFSVDLIGSVAFGLSLNSLNDPSSEFKKMGETIFKPTLKSRLRFALRSHFPRLIRILGWKGIPKETEDFFINVVKDTIKHREDNGIQRNDFLQLLMELRKKDLVNGEQQDDMIFDEKLMTANAFVFLLAGYDTTATTISFMLYEIANNQDIQDEIYQEILEKIDKFDGTTYEAVKEMSLLDQALSETLRLYPPASAIIRVARQPYKVPDTDLELPEGSYVFIPIYSLQHDPKYFPDPEKFDPSRFANESKIPKGTYLPFGDGPRICIGLRLAKMEVKIAVVKILLKYRLSVSPKTQRPFKYNAKTIFLTPIGGIWLNLNERL